MALAIALRSQLASCAFLKSRQPLCTGLLNQPLVKRTLNTELTTALRPFYFAVHPDLFGQHPIQRQTNEESLKLLSAHLESLYERKYHTINEVKVLKFYIRDGNAESRDTFKLIEIEMDKKMLDPKVVIERVLQLCNLSTDYIKTVKSMQPQAVKNDTSNASSSPYKPGGDYQFGSEFVEFETTFQQEKEQKRISLDSWMAENAAKAKTRAKGMSELKTEVEKLQKSLVARLGLRDARYDCGWNIEHYRGCLKSLERLANMHKNQLEPLRDRIVIFAPVTGVSLEGHVMLFTGDVLNNWIDFIRNIPQHDAYLKIVPLYEQALSQVLLGIQIRRRKFMPRQQAKAYADHLMKVTTSLNDYLSRQKFPKSWPVSLSDYKIVIESEAGPLMVSPTGQFIAPATCPGWILVDFITSNLKLAKERMAKYVEEKHVERQLKGECISYLQLCTLTKDDSVTPDKMIITLRHLLRSKPHAFQQINLHVTNYYSVLTDGIVCIPWDFMLR